MHVLAGSRLGRYEIRSLLGVGGMGEVYLAQDMQLRRSVALKILPPEFTRDDDRLKRFKQEAFAASALNHPNIFTIYEIGQDDNTHFIATEYIEGLSLRQELDKGFIELDKILDWGTQMAAALSAAHVAGIIHRDIKPDNVMIRHDGFVKVLDFGLAKLSEYKGLTSDPEAATLQVVKTDPGKVMGTAHYMSPEQTRGLELDHRTDIWSVGVILYEMVAGRVPFEGATTSDVVASILRAEPVPLQRYTPTIPDELQRIIRKALRKDPNERYQLAKEVGLDLKNLRRELELSAEIERSVQPASGSASASLQNNLPDAQIQSKLVTGTITPVQATSSTKTLRWPTLTKVVLGLLALFAVAYASIVIYQWFITSSSQARSNMRITRLTTTGTADSAAISPDGKYIVHVASENGQQSLRVRQVNTNSDVQIVPPSDLHYADLTFSTDGDFIYYIASEQNGSSSNLYVIPALGGNARKLISNVTRSVSLSPDGQQVAFIRNLPDVGEDAVFIANTSGGAERKIASRKLPNFFHSICWLPDQTKLVAAAGSFVPTYNSYLVELPVGGGSEKQISQQTWLSMGDITYVPESKGLIFAASDQESGGMDSKQLWYVSYPRGEAHRVTNDLNNYNGISVTGDSRRLVTLQTETTGNIWVSNSGDSAQATQLTVGTARVDGRDGLAWTRDGQIVYSSQANGEMDLWIMKGDGSNKRQVTSNSRNNHHPVVTADDRYIVFTSDRAGTPNIWRVDIDGSNPKQLTSGSGEATPYCTPDGKWVIYTLPGAGKPTIWRVSIEGGAPQQLINAYATSPASSADGRSIACFYRDEQVNSRIKLAIFNSEGGQPFHTFEISGMPSDSASWPPIAWTNDSRAVNYVVTVGGVSNIWTQPISGEAARQSTSFKSDRIFAFAWSRDGKQLAYSRGNVSSDVVLISNF
ncbi:MAG: hypothetical protein C5B55_12750 [Blastocatellia bacterium]|nr:MAG: hypothetical protein C5B55_12750 [Blastocatellia bacterium]